MWLRCCYEATLGAETCARWLIPGVRLESSALFIKKPGSGHRRSRERAVASPSAVLKTSRVFSLDNARIVQQQGETHVDRLLAEKTVSSGIIVLSRAMSTRGMAEYFLDAYWKLRPYLIERDVATVTKLPTGTPTFPSSPSGQAPR
jgi:hypothetical protein